MYSQVITQCSHQVFTSMLTSSVHINAHIKCTFNVTPQVFTSMHHLSVHFNTPRKRKNKSAKTNRLPECVMHSMRNQYTYPGLHINPSQERNYTHYGWGT